MKRSALLFAFLFCFCLGSFAQKSGKGSIHNGLYLIEAFDTSGIKPVHLPEDQKALKFSALFDEFNEEPNTHIIVRTKEFVPLELEKAPTAQQQTAQKKLLLLSLTPQASEKLKSFTTQHVMQMVAIVVDGEVLTVHKIKEPITSGQLQISRCNDNACERLQVSLRHSIKK